MRSREWLRSAASRLGTRAAPRAFMRTHTELIEYHTPGPFQVLSRIIDFLFGLLYTILLVRFGLELINASHGSGFFRFIVGVTDPFFAPFRGIVGNTAVDGHQVVWPIVVAILAYMILHALIRGLLRLLVRA
jgi:hypothetical protein